jgi:hypothetical protein
MCGTRSCSVKEKRELNKNVEVFASKGQEVTKNRRKERLT